jgi:hypothetical protein
MVNLILIVFFVGVFYVGFKCGNKYKNLSELGAAAKAKIKAKLDSL